MNMLFWIAALATGLLMPAARAKADYEVMTRNDIFFAEHDGVRLFGDFYAPKGLDKAPVLVAVHGGGWQVGNRKFYSNWGPYLAKNGYAVFAIEYRLMKPDVKTYLARSTTPRRQCNTCVPRQANSASIPSVSGWSATVPALIFRR